MHLAVDIEVGGGHAHPPPSIAALSARTEAIALETEGDRVTVELQAAYAAGKAAANFDHVRVRGLSVQLAGIEREANHLQGRLQSISQVMPDDDGWHH